MSSRPTSEYPSSYFLPLYVSTARISYFDSAVALGVTLKSKSCFSPAWVNLISREAGSAVQPAGRSSFSSAVAALGILLVTETLIVRATVDESGTTWVGASRRREK